MIILNNRSEMSINGQVLRARITGTGSYLPENIVTNKDLESRVDTSDEWIRQRTGICQRHISQDHETASYMGIEAGRKAIEAAGLQGSDIDGVIVATSTPDRTFPSVAVHIQGALGVKQGPSFDLQAACSGFVYAMGVADSMIRTGQMRRVLVVGSERLSNILDWQDRGTCVLFGDGAGAVVLEQISYDQADLADPEKALSLPGILSSHLHGNGDLKDILYVNGGVSTTKQAGHIVMNGREVFRNAVELLSDVVEETLEYNQILADKIDWLVPHQANIRIIDGARKKLGLPPENVVVSVDRHGNTSAASIPLAFDEAVRDGRIKKGQLMLFEALGAGLTWGAQLIRF